MAPIVLESFFFLYKTNKQSNKNKQTNSAPEALGLSPAEQKSKMDILKFCEKLKYNFNFLRQFYHEDPALHIGLNLKYEPNVIHHLPPPPPSKNTFTLQLIPH